MGGAATAASNWINWPALTAAGDRIGSVACTVLLPASTSAMSEATADVAAVSVVGAVSDLRRRVLNCPVTSQGAYTCWAGRNSSNETNSSASVGANASEGEALGAQ